jgi:hypothetical protein
MMLKQTVLYSVPLKLMAPIRVRRMEYAFMVQGIHVERNSVKENWEYSILSILGGFTLKERMLKNSFREQLM